MKRQFVQCVLAAGIALGMSAAPAAAQDFTISSSAFQDGGWLQQKNAGNNPKNPNCVGQNVSPPLAWSNVPAKATSLALLMFDPEGRGGMGVSHWVAYGIPVSVTGFAEGEVSKPSEKYVGGIGTRQGEHLPRSVHAARPAAPLHLHADRDDARGEGSAARPHPRGILREVRRQAPHRDRPDRIVEEEVT